MACRTLVVPLRASAYTCDSCLNSVRPFGKAHAFATRAIAAASFRDVESTPRRTQQPHGRGREPRAVRADGNGFKGRPASSRPYSTEIATPQAVISGIATLPHRRLISLSGAEAAKFLQGLITNNVDSTRLSPFYSAFLDARGRVLWDVFIWVWPELVAEQGQWECYIEVDADEAESLKKHLKKHKLRSKIAIKDVPTDGSEGIRVWTAWGGAHENVQEWSEIAGFEDPRAPGLYRYLANADRETIAVGVQPVDAQYYHIQRYLHGIPEGPNEIPRETALPMESNVDLSGGIDFKKGCYVGQELTIRTKHTGVVRKRVLPVRFHANTTSRTSMAQTTDDDDDAAAQAFDPSFSPVPQPGLDIKALDEAGTIKKGRAGGKIIAAIGNVGLASCRLENMTSMRVSAEGGTYKPGTEFCVDVDGQIVKVDPVLHNWFVRRKEVLWDKEERRKNMSAKEQDDGELD
ncbi:putative transferase CAF17, mitochondrial [Ophiobolus disseminans]|uniref:Iron-sulfur cluster assembly factor IBA57 homolog, mitochondrial n=1 Tax=Ophiobolus disseminans TaxID=1469910 RepID=A0A6A6ZZL3_9PLEO|nr:putative transferase CAF17, mitochondrial [Ophiobolus disseminans]